MNRGSARIAIHEKVADMLTTAFDYGKDRAEAIALPVVLEEALEALLRLSMKPDTVVADEFFRPSGPLGTFGTKIKLAYMLNILQKEP